MSDLYAEPDTVYNDPVLLEQVLKIIVVGDIGTGKTSLIKRYVHNIFSINYRSTIGVDFALKIINWDDNTTIRLQLWDIAGQERFGNMTRVYYKEAVGAFVVFDITRKSTFDAVTKWKEDIDKKITFPDTDESIPVVLIANKIDLWNDVDSDDGDDEWTNTKNKLDEFCTKYGFIGWFETSAKDNIGIDLAARSLIAPILPKLKTAEIEDVSNKNINITPIVTIKENKCC